MPNSSGPVTSYDSYVMSSQLFCGVWCFPRPQSNLFIKATCFCFVHIESLIVVDHTNKQQTKIAGWGLCTAGPPLSIYLINKKTMCGMQALIHLLHRINSVHAISLFIVLRSTYASGRSVYTSHGNVQCGRHPSTTKPETGNRKPKTTIAPCAGDHFYRFSSVCDQNRFLTEV